MYLEICPGSKDCEINPEWIAENMKKDGIPISAYVPCLWTDDRFFLRTVSSEIPCRNWVWM